jgi:hypothetical protein
VCADVHDEHDSHVCVCASVITSGSGLHPDSQRLRGRSYPIRARSTWKRVRISHIGFYVQDRGAFQHIYPRHGYSVATQTPRERVDGGVPSIPHTHTHTQTTRGCTCIHAHHTHMQTCSHTTHSPALTSTDSTFKTVRPRLFGR